MSSNYPSGFTGGLTVRNAPIELSFPGNILYANNSTVLAENAIGGSDGNDGTYHRPFATLSKALSTAKASRGDKIYIMPGHAETIATATALAFSKAGVAIIGLGSGTLRPTFTMSAATSTVAVTGADMAIKNCIFTADVADVADCFNVSAANFHIEDCKFTQTATAKNIIEIVDTGTVDNAADGLSFLRIEWIEVDAATTSLVNVDADLDRLSVVDCYIDLGVNGVLSAIGEVAAGKDLTNVNISGNYVSRLVAASAVQLLTFADTTTTNTGIAKDNLCRSLDVAGELLISAGTNISQFDNKSTSVIDKSGYVLPAIDA